MTKGAKMEPNEMQETRTVMLAQGKKIENLQAIVTYQDEQIEALKTAVDTINETLRLLIDQEVERRR